MDGKGRWVDNVTIERWFRSLKTERIYPYEYLTPKALRAGLCEYIEEYNTERPHQSHDMCLKSVINLSICHLHRLLRYELIQQLDQYSCIESDTFQRQLVTLCNQVSMSEHHSALAHPVYHKIHLD